VTDLLRSYSAAKREVMPRVEHIRGGRSNNRAENSHEPARERERRMRRFKSPGHAQRFLATFSVVSNHFRCGRHTLSAANWRLLMARRVVEWHDIAEIPPAMA
jgi:putative transposase